MITEKSGSGAQGMKAAFLRLKDGYIRYVEKQGFPIIVTLCVAVITATALWTSQREEPYVSPTPPVVENVSAAQLMQESLKKAATPSPMPTETQKIWCAPLDEIIIVTPFSTATMLHSGISGIWSIHDAVDLEASLGDKVYAIADGVIIDSGKDQLQGVWIQINHGSGIEALYAGLAMAGTYIPGDDVRAGDTIGFAGNAVLDETDLGPHLHLRITQDGNAIDPNALWRKAE